MPRIQLSDPFPTVEHGPVVPAVIPGISLIKIDIRSDLVFSGGRNWVRTSDPSLVRRNTAMNTPQLAGPVYAAELRKPCPEMPSGAWESLHGGSRKWFPENSVDPTLRKRVRAWRQAYRSRTPRMAGNPVRAPLDRWTGRRRSSGRSGLRSRRTLIRSWWQSALIRCDSLAEALFWFMLHMVTRCSPGAASGVVLERTRWRKLRRPRAVNAAPKPTTTG